MIFFKQTDGNFFYLFSLFSFYDVLKLKFLRKMINFKNNVSSESFYPDSNYYLDEENNPKETRVSEDQISIWGGILNGQIPIGLLQKEQMEDLQ